MRSTRLVTFFLLLYQSIIHAQNITAISIANQSSCKGIKTTCTSDDYFTADVSVSYNAKPANGTLSLSGSDLIGAAPSASVTALGATSHIFTGVKLRADAAAIGLTATFSAGNALTNSNLGTAPASCSNPIPPVLVVGGFCAAGLNGNYVFGGMANGAPLWYHPTFGYAQRIQWSGAAWQIFSNSVVLYVNTGGSAVYFPCTPWTNITGCG